MTPTQKPLDRLILAQSLLCCPDCEAELDTSLRCTLCRRSLAPGEDGIISALPSEMEAKLGQKRELQGLIDSDMAASDRAEKIVLYEKAFHDEQAASYDSLFLGQRPL